MAKPRRARALAPSRIVRDPLVCGGEPTIAGTRVPVRSIAVQWRFYRDVDQIRRSFPRLDEGVIREALAFYEVNSEEIDRLIQDAEQVASEAN